MLTPETQSAILEALNLGNYLETSARYGGVTPQTVYNWLDRGRIERDRLENDGEPDDYEARFVEFLDLVEKARARSETRAVGLIQKAAADGTWQAAAWYLERSAPKRWGRRANVELTGKDGGAVQVEAVSAEELEAKVREILGGADDD